MVRDEDEHDQESVGQSRDTANRLLGTAKAASNHAFDTGRVPDDRAWRRVKAFDGADMAREIILAHRLARTPGDQAAEVPLVDAVKAHTDATPREVSADAGFCSEATLAAMAERRIKADFATGRAKDPAGGEAQRHAAPGRAPQPLSPARARGRARLRPDHLDPEQVRLAFGFGDSLGGYKTPSLIGLYWSPPYLHDGGVAVGPNGELGLPAMVYRFLRPDPEASLEALVDRELRACVVAANRADPRLELVNVTGEGHRYWVDEQAGFTTAEQRVLVVYLLSYAPDPHGRWQGCQCCFSRQAAWRRRAAPGANG